MDPSFSNSIIPSVNEVTPIPEGNTQVSVLSVEEFTSNIVSQVGSQVTQNIFTQLVDVLPTFIDQALSKKFPEGSQNPVENGSPDNDNLSIAASDNLDKQSSCSLFDKIGEGLGPKSLDKDIGSNISQQDRRLSVLRENFIPSDQSIDISSGVVGTQPPIRDSGSHSSARDIGAQQISLRDEGAHSTSLRDIGAHSMSSVGDLINDSGKRKRADDLDMVPSLLEGIDDEMPDNPDLGAEILAPLAERVKKAFIENSAINKSLQEIMKKYKTPSNALCLRVPKVPPQIRMMDNFQDNKSFVKSNETSMYSTQNYVAKTATIFANIVEHVMIKANAGEIIDAKQVSKDCLRGITLLGHVSAELERKRKNNLRNILDQKFHSICGPKPGSDEAKKEKPKNSGTEFLFGDDFNQVAKDARNLHNMANQTQTKASNKSQSSSSSSSSFLDRGNKPPQPPYKGRNQRNNGNNNSHNSNNYNNKGKQPKGKKN